MAPIMTSAIQCDFPYATASGAADAPCPAVRGHANKYTTRTANLQQTNATASGATNAPCPAVRGHLDKCATRTLNILQLNINGTQRKIDELSCLLHDNNIHIACLQETKLNPNLCLKIKGYTVIRKDRINNLGGGLAFLVKTPIVKYEEFSPAHNLPCDSSTEAHAINLLLPKCTITIVNVYHPNNSEIDADSIKHLYSSSSDVKLLLGDFNAKSPSWGCPHLDNRGEEVEDLLSDLNLSTLNTGINTYLSKTNGTASALDITAIDLPHLNYAEWKVIKSAISDHFPVITTLKLDVDSTPQNNKSWNFRKANWGNFTENLETFCQQIPAIKNLDNFVQLFTCGIQKAAKLSIPRGKRKNDWVPYWKDHNIDALIHERDTACLELEKNNNDVNRRKLIDISHKVEEEIVACKREKWADFCSRLDPRKDHQHWKVIEVLNNRYTQQNNGPTSNVIASNGQSSNTDKDAANLLATHYEKASKLSFQNNDKKQRRTYKQVLQQSKLYEQKDTFTDKLTLEELDCAIKNLDPKKSPGIDLIFGPMIKHFGASARLTLLQIFNLSWKTGKLPTIWKKSIIIPILKPGKDANSCKNYRPISLTSTLCKLMERIIHTRTMNWLINHNVLHFYQTAFRAGHSTVDQLFYLVQSIIDGLQEKPHKKTTAVFLDLSAAFDRVWRQKLIEVIHSAGIKGNSLLWINDFLRQRKFVVRVNGNYSKMHRLWAGVPQGSVLSPLLFLLYMNTIHGHIGNEAKIACYADDIAIWHTHSDITVSENALNINLHGIEAWAKDLKLQINPEKSKSCVFSTDRRNRQTYHPNIRIHNTAVEQITNPKYLGLTLDAELRFTKHIETVSQRALKKLGILRKLCGSTWGSKPKTLLNTYTALIRPILEYAAPIWAPASSSSKVDSVQYRASKTIIGAVSSTNNLKAETECGLAPLANRRKFATVKFTNKIRSSHEQHISNVTFRNWSTKNRLKRSSTLQYDKNIRHDINLQHTCLDITQESRLPINPPPSVKINLDLLEPCTKKEPQETIKRKGLETIIKLSKPHLVTAYTDGSSNSDCDRGGSGIFITYPDGSTSRHKIPAGKIASNFTSELVAIKEALSIYLTWTTLNPSDGIIIFSDCKSALEALQKGKTNLAQKINTLLLSIEAKKKLCTLQWIPAHVDIEGNEEADSLAKEARTIEPSHLTITSANANAVAKQRLCAIPRKKLSLPELNHDRVTTATIARLRTMHLKGMKIMRDGSRTYLDCRHCPDTQLDPEHIFNCPSILSALSKIDLNCTRETLYTDRAGDVARAVLHAFGPI